VHSHLDRLSSNCLEPLLRQAEIGVSQLRSAIMIGQVKPIMRSNTDTGNVKIFFIIVFFCIQPPVLDRGLFQYRRGEKDGVQVWYISQNGG
jgi:hypothetical protein